MIRAVPTQAMNAAVLTLGFDHLISFLDPLTLACSCEQICRFLGYVNAVGQPIRLHASSYRN
jgi:hypothetical protein